MSEGWWQCIHCGHREHESGGISFSPEMVRCAACKALHSAPSADHPKALRHAIAELAARLAWRQIRTAPKDRPVLAFAPSLRGGRPAIIAARWSEDIGEWFPVFSNEPVAPTHWMPLPDPPEQNVGMKTMVKTGGES